MDLSTIVDVCSVIAVVSGLVFAGLELRQLRKSRERESALELFNTFQTPEFSRGLQSLVKLPDGQSRAQIEDVLGERMDDVYYITSAFEGLGAMVQKGEISLRLVRELFSGSIVITWMKLRRLFEEDRKHLKRETWGEWMQWLAERVIEREEQGDVVPAHIAHKDWQPG
jgi:hypothetical protein